nr:YkgJ family cysteine cluster protein [Candidatus Freyarchaeota archaeon]
MDCSGCEASCCKNLVKARGDLKVGLFLLSQEKRRLAELASKKGLGVDIRPLHYLETSLGEQKILTHQMVNRDCEFLDRKANRCIIYDGRPLVCRSYPIQCKLPNTDMEIDLDCKNTSSAPSVLKELGAEVLSVKEEDEKKNWEMFRSLDLEEEYSAYLELRNAWFRMLMKYGKRGEATIYFYDHVKEELFPYIKCRNREWLYRKMV